MATELVKLLAQTERKAKKGRRRLRATKPNRRADVTYLVQLGATINITVLDFVASPVVTTNGTRYIVTTGSGVFDVIG